MKTENQIKAWLKIKLNNLAYVCSPSSRLNFSTTSTGLKRLRNRLKKILEDLDNQLIESGHKWVQNDRKNI